MGQQGPQPAALYSRVSTVDQSCARQDRDPVAFSERAGYELVGTYKETASGVRLDSAERRSVLALAQRRKIDAVLVTPNGMAFDLTTPHERMMETLLAGIAEFGRELIQKRIRSGVEAAEARGKRLGRQPGQRPKSDRLAPEVMPLVGQGRSYRRVGRKFGSSKTTVVDSVQRTRAAAST